MLNYFVRVHNMSAAAEVFFQLKELNPSFFNTRCVSAIFKTLKETKDYVSLYRTLKKLLEHRMTVSRVHASTIADLPSPLYTHAYMYRPISNNQFAPLHSNFFSLHSGVEAHCYMAYYKLGNLSNIAQ